MGDVSGIGTGHAWRMLLRSLLIQASWNYRTLIGTGFAFALLPVLRRVYAEDPEALRRAVHRHASLFNSHPYLSPLALGAVARLEAEGESPLVIERFKTAVRGSLGTMGDRLVWTGWRPVTVLVGLVLLVAGAAAWVAVLVFLALYNLGHFGLRVWSLRLGLGGGKAVGERLRGSVLLPTQRLLSLAGAFLLGLVLPLFAAGGLAPVPLDRAWIAGAALAGALGLALGERVRPPVVLFLTLFTGFGLVIGWLA